MLYLLGILLSLCLLAPASLSAQSKTPVLGSLWQARLLKAFDNQKASAGTAHCLRLASAEAGKGITENLKRNAKVPATLDITDKIKTALKLETDPFARSEMAKARDLLAGQKDYRDGKND